MCTRWTSSCSPRIFFPQHPLGPLQTWYCVHWYLSWKRRMIFSLDCYFNISSPVNEANNIWRWFWAKSKIETKQDSIFFTHGIHQMHPMLIAAAGYLLHEFSQLYSQIYYPKFVLFKFELFFSLGEIIFKVLMQFILYCEHFITKTVSPIKGIIMRFCCSSCRNSINIKSC